VSASSSCHAKSRVEVAEGVGVIGAYPFIRVDRAGPEPATSHGGAAVRNSNCKFSYG
jgi:hypothetical protein